MNHMATAALGGYALFRPLSLLTLALACLWPRSWTGAVPAGPQWQAGPATQSDSCM
ncbi:hypothetical protein LCGC14_1750350 [marine sediment metagenome]|uniref:Uncharacterized protein n=1 Tax=marine sediment metagenome TaxID=412755 RepID=A0A0F9JJ86_9ZZZZ